jgi:digalactosyldiacylglycerol synthase
MVPWGVESEAQPVTAEKAMSFISKSWLDVRKSADEDLKRMRARAKSFTELAYSFDKELENLRKASLNLGSESNASAGSLTRTLQNGGGLYTAFNRSNFEELEFLVKPLSQFRRTQSNPDLGNQQKQLTGNMAGPQPKADLSLLRQAFIPRVNDEDFFLKGSEGMKTQWAARNRITVRGKDGFKSDSKGSKKAEPSNEEWEPLRKMKESWRDLESSAANCKSPSEFFDNLKKTQLFENVKKNLVWSVHLMHLPHFQLCLS